MSAVIWNKSELDRSMCWKFTKLSILMFSNSSHSVRVYILSPCLPMWYIITQWKMLGWLESIHCWNCFPDQCWSFKSLKAWLEKELYQHDGQFHLLLLTYQFVFYSTPLWFQWLQKCWIEVIPWLQNYWIAKSERTKKRWNNPTRCQRQSFRTYNKINTKVF